MIYAPGVLEARAYKIGEDGVVWEVIDVVKTSGPPAGFDLVMDWPLPDTILQANGKDVVLLDIRLVDEEGIIVPMHGPTLATFVLNGPGRILGVGNGDPSCHEPDSYPDTPTRAKRSVFNGHARIILQTTKEEGDIMLQVTSNNANLKSKSILIPVGSGQAAGAAATKHRVLMNGSGGVELLHGR